MEGDKGGVSRVCFTCRLCRRVLFRSDALEEHQTGLQSFQRRKELKSGASGGSCSSYFVREKLEWMEDMREVEGKILCPNAKCNARLGGYKWVGSQCSCGSWVTPAIQFPMSKVDEKQPVGAADIGAVCHPSIGQRALRISQNSKNMQARGLGTEGTERKKHEVRSTARIESTNGANEASISEDGAAVVVRDVVGELVQAAVTAEAGYEVTGGATAPQHMWQVATKIKGFGPELCKLTIRNRQPGPLYVRLIEEPVRNLVLIQSFDGQPGGAKCEVEKAGFNPGDALVGVNSVSLVGKSFDGAVGVVRAAAKRRADCVLWFRKEELGKRHLESGGAMEAEKLQMLQEVLVDEQTHIDEKKLRALAMWGLPEGSLRPMAWRLLLNYLPYDKTAWAKELSSKRELYASWVKDLMGTRGKPCQSQPKELTKMPARDEALLDDIKKDIMRTMTDHQFFADAARNAALERLLFVYAKLHIGVHYVQGMNEIAGTLYYVLATDPDKEWQVHSEPDSFWLFQSVMGQCRDLYMQSLDSSESGMHGTIADFSELLRINDRRLHARFQAQDLQPSFYAMRYFSTLLAREFVLPDTIRLWDSLFADGNHKRFVCRLCVSMLIEQRVALLEGDFAANMKLLQSYPPTDVARLLERCLILREVERTTLQDDIRQTVTETASLMFDRLKDAASQLGEELKR
ncbi:unnamed protein product [Chrysoparadoxa australica]